MNLRKTLILAAVLAAAALYLKQVSLPGRERQRTERMAFSRLASDSIESIEVANGAEDSKPYTLEQRGAMSNAQAKAPGMAWDLRGVPGAVLDQTQIVGLLSGLGELEVEGPLDERETGYDVSVFGLDKPALTLTVNEKGNERAEVAFGKKNEYLSKRYVKISGKKGIFLADEERFAAVNKSVFDIRSKTPCSFVVSDLRSLVIATKAGRVKLVQDIVGSWKIVEPTQLPASTEAVETLLNTLKGLNVAQFIDQGSARHGEFGLDSPEVTMSLSFREGIEPRDITYKVSGNRASGSESATYVSSSTTDTVYKLTSDPTSQFTKSPNDLRERRIVPYEESDIKKLSATLDDGQKVEIAVSGVSWTINGKQSDPVFTQQFLKDVASFSASEFPASVPADAFHKPMLALDIIKDVESNQRMTVTIGAEMKGANQEAMRFVKTSASDTIYAVRDIEAKRVVPREEALVERATPAPK
ncbi:MAG: hypothetical protein RL326_1434, partial [Pseudomonadota bacterium]